MEARRTGLLATLAMLAACAMAQMPVVRLNGDFGDEYSQGTMSLTDAGGATASYNVEAKWRGHTAKQYDKKAFAVKLLDGNGDDLDASLLGMREDNSWILDAMAADKARMRNRVSFDLWNDFSSPTYIKSEYEPESANGTHGHFVELYLNGSYHGIYCLTEKIDRKQLKLKKYKDGVRGLLYKADSWDGTNFYSYTDFDNSMPTWMGWESQYPEVEDEGTTDWEPLHDAVKFALEATDAEFAGRAALLYDLPVWTDYFIFIRLLLAIDNHGKNTFAYLYDKTADSRLGIAPWDLDATWGRNYDGSTLAPDIFNGSHRLLDRLAGQEGYMESMAERYFELRKDVFSADSLKARFRNYFDYFEENGASQREEERWGGVNGVELDFAAERAYIENWIDGRLAAVDGYFGAYTTPVGKVEAEQQSAPSRIYDLQGRPVGENDLKDGEVYIMDGEKVLNKCVW